MATKTTLRLDKGAVNNLLKGRDGAVNRMVGGFAGLATRTVREVSDEKITHRTRNYRNSIKATLTAPSSLAVVADVEYAAILELGSKPHPIVPRSPGGVLVFDVGGETVFARRVQHPGTSAYNILSEGIAKAGGELNRLAAR